MKSIPGLNVKSNTDLPVLHRVDIEALKPDNPSAIRFSQWMGGLPVVKVVLVLMLMPLASSLAWANSNYTSLDAFDALWRWMPFLLREGFFFNVLISVFVMIIGTAIGVVLGLGQISIHGWLRKFSWGITQLFRNSPWLVLIFVVMLALPFEISLFGFKIYIPDWVKAVIGLSLPVMANVSEIVRGAVLSVPSGQWEASESLAYTRLQTLWKIILPQCFKRMIPPWMNWYAILTMATPLISILGIEDILKLSRDAMEAEGNQPELLVPFYSFILLLFFAYCYPIARWTQHLERKFSVKG
ncbi:MAG: amino acid ABC transporter permease [Granulosicoccaceae bacterium]